MVVASEMTVAQLFESRLTPAIWRSGENWNSSEIISHYSDKLPVSDKTIKLDGVIFTLGQLSLCLSFSQTVLAYLVLMSEQCFESSVLIFHTEKFLI